MLNDQHVALTHREREVLRAWLLADNRAQVAHRLSIEVSTVSAHIERIRRKYQGVGRRVPTKAALLAQALSDGFIELRDFDAELASGAT